MLGVFLLNWQPAASIEILIFAVFPVAVYFSKNVLHWQPWIENMLAIAIGNVLLYSIILGHTAFARSGAFLVDLVGGLIFGTFIFVSLRRWGEVS